MNAVADPPPNDPRWATATAVLATRTNGTRHGTTTQLLHGLSLFRTDAPLGQLHWIPPHQLVIYQARSHRCRTFVFRTVMPTEAEVTRLAGVHRPVRLLSQAATLDRAALLARFVRWIVREGRDPSALPDVFYRRLDVILHRRGTKDALLQGLLAHHDTLATR